VLDQQQRDARGRDASQELRQGLLVGSREARRRFVEQQHGRARGECARDLDQPPVYVRQVAACACRSPR